MLRLALDINVFVADMLARRERRMGCAATKLADWVATGTSPAGPTQLIVSYPMIEAYADVLRRKFGYDDVGAREKSDLLAAYATEGPIPTPPFIAVGMGYVPFETEMQLRMSLETFASQEEISGKLFHETQDDRYVIETAIADRADILVTSNLVDFKRGDAVIFERDDAIVFPFAAHDVVVAKPAFAAHWIERGVVPNVDFIRSNPAEFVVAASRSPRP